ncbi:MAG: glycosyltransferase family 9 protein [Deltaproteobacteria bacterium]|nr:glycosyltransferase family 9 protein [Deltaproteobacteria bacterium]
MRNVLIVKPSALGDVIQATAVLPVIKETFPRARVSWLVFEQNAGALQGNPLIDRLIVVKRKGLGPMRIVSLVRELRREHFDLVVDLQCLLRSGLIAYAAGSGRRAGYANGRELSTLFYNEPYEIPRDMHAVDGYLLMCRMLGCREAEEVRFVLPGGEAERSRVERLLRSTGGCGPVVAVCPTAGWPTKTWPEAGFARTADLLVDEYGARVLWLGSPKERPVGKRAAGLMKHPSRNLVGELSLPEVAVLLQPSDLFVGNDSGLMHMAAAAGTRTAVVFGPTDPGRTGPYTDRARVVTAGVDCQPCFKKKCGDLKCLAGLTPEDLMAACRALLDH